MNCPICNNIQLVMTERQGIEIDYCPQCRGVWLDRGELDKIIERSINMPNAAPSSPPEGFNRQAEYDRRYDDHHDKHHHDHDDHHDGYYNKRKKSFWSEIFD